MQSSAILKKFDMQMMLAPSLTPLIFNIKKGPPGWSYLLIWRFVYFEKPAYRLKKLDIPQNENMVKVEAGLKLTTACEVFTQEFFEECCLGVFHSKPHWRQTS